MHAALFYAVLCAAGSATFATLVRSRRDAAVGAVCAAAAASLMLGGRAADAVWLGTAAAAAAGLLVVRPAGRTAAACGGALAGFWAANLAAAGVPRGVALAVMLLPAVSAVFAQRRPTFAPAALREEALLLVLVLALLAAAAPVVASGWRTAAALQPIVDGNTPGAISAWPLAVAAAAFVLGLSFSLWKHR